MFQPSDTKYSQIWDIHRNCKIEFWPQQLLALIFWKFLIRYFLSPKLYLEKVEERGFRFWKIYFSNIPISNSATYNLDSNTTKNQFFHFQPFFLQKWIFDKLRSKILEHFCFQFKSIFEPFLLEYHRDFSKILFWPQKWV